MGTEKNFTPRVAALIHVTNILAHKVADYRCFDLPHQVCRKNKSAVQRNYYI
jgi:hypothetical protein